MRRVIIESPYAGDVVENIKYARRCVRNSVVEMGEAPIASHLLFTQPSILNDDIEDERKLGMEAGWEWVDVAHVIAFYIDRGISKGMKSAFLRFYHKPITYEFRTTSMERPLLIFHWEARQEQHYQVILDLAIKLTTEASSS